MRVAGPRVAKTRDAGRLALDLGQGLRPGLVGAFARVLDHARASTATAHRDPRAAVHAWRKAVRRAWAVLRFARPLLREAAYRRVASKLTRAMRRTSAVRDAQVLADTLRAVPQRAGTGRSRRLLGDSLRRCGEGQPPTRVAALLVEATGEFAGVTETFERALAARVGWRDVEESLRRTHRRVRRAWRQARRGGEDRQVHEWRKRTKELRYGLEMLSSSAGGFARKQHRALARLAEDLGEVTDLMILHDFVSGWEKESADRDAEGLLREVRRLVRKKLSRALDRAEPVLARRPRRFARKTVASVRSQRTPPAR
jgi:CHAD domain-containing protein